MALIRLYEAPDFNSAEEIRANNCLEWIIANTRNGENFAVFKDSICRQNDITKNPDEISGADSVIFVRIPASGAIDFTLTLINPSLALTKASFDYLNPKIGAVNGVNTSQGSPNNDFGNRNNTARPNERIVDLVGKSKSIPDVIQQEFERFNGSQLERIGYYGVARGQVQIENVSDGDSLIEDIAGSSAGVYYPFKSPNNAAPDIQIGEPINEPVVGVVESTDATGQPLRAPNDGSLKLRSDVIANSQGYLFDPSGEQDFNLSFSVGEDVELVNLVVDREGGGRIRIGENTSEITAITQDRIDFDISNDPSWSEIEGGGEDLKGGENPVINNTTSKLVGPFKITKTKLDRLLVNVYAPSGLFRDKGDGPQRTDVEYQITVNLLDDNFLPIGSPIVVSETISGKSTETTGLSSTIDLPYSSYVEFSLLRITPEDFDYDGQIVDEIQLKSAYGLYDKPASADDHFGDITTIQTKRSNVASLAVVKNPELNCIATELVYKYENGSFNPNLTPNIQGMQSVIRLALDPLVGRRTVDEIDLDNLVSIQDTVEQYFGTVEAAGCHYSFDRTETKAQEVLSTIANAMFCVLKRKGRVISASFDGPQTFPKMIFTHRSKKLNGAEKWNRNLNNDKDSVELKYVDDTLYTEETIYIPEDRSGTNPEKIEISGIKGRQQALWRANREFNKLKSGRITVDFSAMPEGVFVEPNNLIGVVKGSRVGTYDGEIREQNGLELTLSQDVKFTEGDDHFILLKNRDGSVTSIPVTEGASKRKVLLQTLPTEPIYTGNSEGKTEFSFGNEALLESQLMVAQEIKQGNDGYVNIKAINYSDDYYKDDPQQIPGGFSDGFDDGFN